MSLFDAATFAGTAVVRQNHRADPLSDRPRVQRRARLRMTAGLFAAMVIGIGGIAWLQPALDPDLGWHLRTGQWIIANRSIPTIDPFSLTRRGAPWVDQEWLWQLIMTLTGHATGPVGVAAVNAALVTAGVLAVYARLRVRLVAPLFAGVGGVLTLIDLASGSTARPATAVVPLAAFYLFAFEQFRICRGWRWLAGLLPIQVLWANLHGSFVVGVGLCGLYGIAVAIDSRSWQQLQPWVVTLAGLVFASFLNPLGLGLWRFVLFASTLPFNRERIAEWQPPQFGHWGTAPLLLSIMLSVALGAYSRRQRLETSQTLLLIACTLAALSSRQFTLLYSVAVAPILTEGLFEVLGRPRQTEVSWLSAFALGITGLAVVVLGPVRHFAWQSYETAAAQYYPVAAVDFLKRDVPPSPLWAEYNWSGWLMGQLPEYPLFVDGRTELFGNELMETYGRVDRGVEPAGPVLDQYAINGLIIDSGGPLANELRLMSGWTEKYRDGMASVFLRVE